MYSPELELVGRRIGAANRLRDQPSQQLEQMAKSYIAEHGHENVSEVSLFFNEDDPIFKTLGALDVLRERHGEDYVARITGLRLPKTLYEKVIYFFTRKPIPLKEGHQHLLFS